MLRSFLIGLVAGSRALTPLAAVSDAVERGALPRDNGAPGWLGSPTASLGLKALAAAELAGDKMRSTPDRIVLASLLARIASGGLAGAALAPRRQAATGALLVAAAAFGAAYLNFGLRMLAMRRFGQTPTGALEDALTVGAAQWVVGGGIRRPA